MRNDKIRRTLLALTLGAAAISMLQSRPAAAAVLCDGERPLPSFIWVPLHLVGGQTYVFQTENLTSGSDTVMYLMWYAPGTTAGDYRQVAVNDDYAGSLSSRIEYTPGPSGDFAVLVRSFSSDTAGRADLVLDDATLVTQSPFGANLLPSTTVALFDRIRVTSTRRYQGQDPMLFVLRDPLQILQMDDDSGPNFYSRVELNNAYANSVGSPFTLLWGHFPSVNPGAGRLTIEPFYTPAFDADRDGLMDVLELSCGLNPFRVDTDADTIPDAMELHGNEGFSFSLGSQYGDSATRRNVYVEIDTMNNPAQVASAYANLVTDMAAIYNQDGAIDLYVEPDTSLGPPSLSYSPVVGFTCAGANSVFIPNCTLFITYKAASFSNGQPERKPYFHYFVYGDQIVNNAQTPAVASCNSGIAQLLGTDGMVALGKTCLGITFPPTTAQQRGTTMHEVGHNVNLTHNGNGNLSGANGIADVSVMNYRYQFTGVPPTPSRPAGSIFVHTYSFGAQPCAPCATSAKARCVAAQQIAILAFLNPNFCVFIDPGCDCDIAEWNVWLLTDFVNGTRNPFAGAGAGASVSDAGAATVGPSVGDAGVAANDAGPGTSRVSLLPPTSADEFASTRAAIVRNQLSPQRGRLKGTGRGTWQGDIPDPASPTHRAALVLQQVADLEARGLVRDKDFRVADDGLSIVQSCP